mgnify:FL=1
MSGRRSRTKGHSFERHVANLFKQLGFEARRGLQYRDGEDAADVVGVADYWIECKRGKRVAIKRAMNQASEACKDKQPIVVSKEDRSPIFVTMKFDTFAELLCPSQSTQEN